MRKLLRNIVITLLGSFSKPKPGIHIINAHYIHPFDDNDAGELFIRQLTEIQKYGDLIRFEKAVELIKKKAKVGRPLIAFSFDDGFLDCYNTIAPILERFNTNAAFFINPNFIECSESYYDEFSKRVTVNGKKAMTWDQVMDLRHRGHIIGAHTMDHLNLGNPFLTELDLERQIVDCKKVIEDKIGNNCNTFAFPYGTLKDIEKRALQILGQHYEFIFSGTNYKNYFSLNNQIINRRHIEPFWTVSHMKYFLSTTKQY